MEFLICLLIAASFALGYYVKTYVGQRCTLMWIDQTTGLPGRPDFERAVQLGLKAGSGLGLIIVDLDNFKVINDQQGHLAGDLKLQSAAKKLLEITADEGMLFRWGGDEFVLLVPNSSQDLSEVGHRLETEFNASTLGLTCSTGYALQQENDTPETLFDRADQILYSNKS